MSAAMRSGVDHIHLRVLAVGNHEAGYQGVIRIEGDGPPWEWSCRHAHGPTAEARNCARQAIRRVFDEVRP